MKEHPMQLRDLRFALYEHLDVPGATGVDREQLDLILEGGAKFAKDVLAPINPLGDKKPVVRHDDGSVTVSPGYKEAFDQYRQDGWTTMAAPASVRAMVPCHSPETSFDAHVFFCSSFARRRSMFAHARVRPT